MERGEILQQPTLQSEWATIDQEYRDRLAELREKYAEALLPVNIAKEIRDAEYHRQVGERNQRDISGQFHDRVGRALPGLLGGGVMPFGEFRVFVSTVAGLYDSEVQQALAYAVSAGLLVSDQESGSFRVANQAGEAQ